MLYILLPSALQPTPSTAREILVYIELLCRSYGWQPRMGGKGGRKTLRLRGGKGIKEEPWPLETTLACQVFAIFYAIPPLFEYLFSCLLLSSSPFLSITLSSFPSKKKKEKKEISRDHQLEKMVYKLTS